MLPESVRSPVFVQYVCIFMLLAIKCKRDCVCFCVCVFVKVNVSVCVCDRDVGTRTKDSSVMDTERTGADIRFQIGNLL